MSHTTKTIKKILLAYIHTIGRGRFIFTIVFGVILAIFGSLEPLIFTQIIKKIEIYLSTGSISIEQVLFILVFWLVFTLVFIILAYIFDYFFLGKSIIEHYHRQSLYYAQKIINMSFSEYLGKQIGSLYKILDRGTENQLFFLYTLLLGVLRSISSVLFISVILFIIDWKMALVTLSLVPVGIFIGSLVYKKISPTQKSLDQSYARGFGIIGDGLSNFGLTKALTLEKLFYNKMSSLFERLYGKQLRVSKGWSLAHGYTTAIVMLSRIGVITTGLYFILHEKMTFSTLFLFFSYIGWIYFPLGFLFEQLRNFQKYLTAVELMYDEFDTLDFEETDTGKKLKKVSGNIVFKNVSFGYDKKKKILKNINLNIKQGEKIALVGNTGAGKSTIVNLILRFWDIEYGSIELDRIDIRELKKSSLRSHIGVVSQDNSLFNLSIEENLKFANPKATKKDIKRALENAEAQFVFDLPEGIKTVIGERGLKLSGGEKQRISIARLFLKDPEILLLDEATSALDNMTEKKIEKALKKLMKGKTSIIIAHRLSTIQYVDNIFVLENGKIVESGNYKTLMMRKEKFWNLANPDKLILG